jgi:hypothetical protein
MKKHEYDQQTTQQERELAWKIKRSSRITASGIAKLMTGGRGAANEFGKVAMDYIDDIVFQIRENDLVGEIDAWQMQFGRDHEEDAVHWLRENFMEEIKHGASDFGSVLFMEVGDYFGSSPDGIVYSNDEPISWLEIKVPANKKKACNLTIEGVLPSDVVDEYKWQFIGHFIANPNLDYGWYVIYNAHNNEITGEPYNRGRVFLIERENLANEIEATEAKIARVYEFIKLCVAGLQKVENINAWWANTESE